MRERDIQARVVAHARQRGVLARKLDFGEGWPDFMFLYGGRVLFMEFKGDRGRVSPLQSHMQNQLERHGFRVELCEGILAGEVMIDTFVAQRGTDVVDLSDIIKP